MSEKEVALHRALPKITASSSGDPSGTADLATHVLNSLEQAGADHVAVLARAVTHSTDDEDGDEEEDGSETSSGEELEESAASASVLGATGETSATATTEGTTTTEEEEDDDDDESDDEETSDEDDSSGEDSSGTSSEDSEESGGSRTSRGRRRRNVVRKTTVKWVFGEQIRRAVLDKKTRYSKLVKQLEGEAGPGLRLVYHDVDGDAVTIKSTKDLHHAMAHHHEEMGATSRTALRIYIVPRGAAMPARLGALSHSESGASVGSSGSLRNGALARSSSSAESNGGDSRNYTHGIALATTQLSSVSTQRPHSSGSGIGFASSSGSHGVTSDAALDGGFGAASSSSRPAVSTAGSRLRGSGGPGLAGIDETRMLDERVAADLSTSPVRGTPRLRVGDSAVGGAGAPPSTADSSKSSIDRGRVGRWGGTTREVEPEAVALAGGIRHWQKGELLGSGSFGKVYAALNLETGEQLAVKQVRLGENNTSERQVEALEREVQLLRNLEDHPNIVKYLGTQRTAKKLFIFLEYASGGSVRSTLSRFGPFSEAVIRRYVLHTLQGLAFLHEHNIIHRDIKASNLLVNNGVVKLADFGSSKKIMDGDDPGGISGDFHTAAGTAQFMAPEVMKEGVPYGKRADIWSLGITAIEMATGKPPWAHPAQAVYKICMTDETPPLPDGLSTEAQHFLRQCLIRDPEARPSAAEMLTHPFLRDPVTGNPDLFVSRRPGTTRAASRQGGLQEAEEESGSWGAAAMGKDDKPRAVDREGGKRPESGMKADEADNLTGSGSDHVEDGRALVRPSGADAPPTWVEGTEESLDLLDSVITYTGGEYVEGRPNIAAGPPLDSETSLKQGSVRSSSASRGDRSASLATGLVSAASMGLSGRTTPLAVSESDEDYSDDFDDEHDGKGLDRPAAVAVEAEFVQEEVEDNQPVADRGAASPVTHTDGAARLFGQGDEGGPGMGGTLPARLQEAKTGEEALFLSSLLG